MTFLREAEREWLAQVEAVYSQGSKNQATLFHIAQYKSDL